MRLNPATGGSRDGMELCDGFGRIQEEGSGVFAIEIIGGMGGWREGRGRREGIGVLDGLGVASMGIRLGLGFKEGRDEKEGRGVMEGRHQAASSSPRQGKRCPVRRYMQSMNPGGNSPFAMLV